MQPDLILTPFGENATPGTIDPIPETRGPGDDPQQATWDEGFPLVTMTPLAAGGIPPKGQDFNGVLNAISEHTVFTGRGGQYKWSSAYVTASGGYSIGDVIQADDGLNSYVSLVNTNTANFNTTPASIGVSWALYAGRKTQDQATETTSGIAEIATQAEVTTGADDARMVTPLKLAQRLATSSPAAGASRNARMNIAAASASATWTADENVVKTALGGSAFLLSALSVSINTAGTGIGGMDTGLAPVSGDVALYLAYNPTTNTRGLFGQDVTAIVAPEQYGGANRPSGFTATQLVAVLKTNASRQFVISNTSGRKTTSTDVVPVNTSAGLTLALTSIAQAVPKNAIRVSGTLAAAATAGSGGVSTTISGFASGLGSQSVAGYSTSPNGCNVPFRDLPLATPQTIWVTTSLAGPGTGLFTVIVKEYEI